jgi:hypothetical protein
MTTTPVQPSQRKPGSPEWLLKTGLLVASLTLAMAISEVVVRIYFPIYGGVDNLSLTGEPVREVFRPGSVYRQYSNEYDAITTITDKGHRVPGPGMDGNPDVIFLGDSFTYGFGLTDDQTFASIYCTRRQLACANLGMPGSGTLKQVRRLKQFVNDFHWRPREVKLFFFGMSGSFSNGNDFVDNYNFGRRLAALSSDEDVPEAPPDTLSGRLIKLQRTMLEHSYLMRHVKYNWGPLLKGMVVDEPGEVRMAEALKYTRLGLQELDEYSRQIGFEYRVYLIVPVQDLTRGSYGDTLKTLNEASPRGAIATAPALLDAPLSYYYAYDGHLNPAGSRRVAEFLLSHDTD